MKKTIALFALVLCVLAGLVSGSLAIYTKAVDVGDGSVVAKKFYLTAAGDTETYKDNVLIAPTETVTAAFTVSNNDSAGYTTEVGMDLTVLVTLDDATGKTAIPYITARLLDAGGDVVTAAVNEIENGKGTISLVVEDAFAPNVASTLTYQIELTWESHAGDYTYQGPGFGTAYSVNVTGRQDID